MASEQLESITIDLENRKNWSDLQKSLEILRLSKEVINEVQNARTKCYSIEEIDGMRASVVGLTITGTESVETIGIRYISNNESYSKKYTRQDFYKL